MMYARLATGSISPAKIDEAVRLWRESVAPSAKQQKGFKSARLLVDRRTGKITSIGFWESETDLQASRGGNPAQINKYNSLFSSPPAVEQYEVAVEVV
jgi:heme-degrading monooxygenase HmoA